MVDDIVEEFGIRVNLTERVEVEGLGRSSRVYLAKLPHGTRVYILDTPEIRALACHPHIVGEEFARLNLEAAREAAKTLLTLTPLGDAGRDEVVFQHVLRAAPGYRLHEALREMGIGFREVWVRPRYVTPSYRDHDEDQSKRLEIVYEDFSQLPEGGELIVVKPDTEASGRTALKSLERLRKAAEERGARLHTLIIYGFISEYGLRAVDQYARSIGFKETHFLAAGNITALCRNLYDMPLYGPDESHYQETGEIKLISGIVDQETLTDYLPEFIPGADQPGDWSARQTRVYTGHGYEPGGIEKHLRNSISLLESLWKLSKNQPWFREFHRQALRKELQALQETLNQYIKP